MEAGPDALAHRGVGLLHCGSSVVVVVATLWAAQGLGLALELQSWRGDWAAMLLLGAGIALAVNAAWRRRARARGAPRVVPLLLVVFALGPCEWLIPNAWTAAADHGMLGALLISGVFTVATVTTMLVAVWAGVLAATRVRVTLDASMVTGLCMAVCGGAMMLGL